MVVVGCIFMHICVSIAFLALYGVILRTITIRIRTDSLRPFTVQARFAGLWTAVLARTAVARRVVFRAGRKTRVEGWPFDVVVWIGIDSGPGLPWGL